MRYRQVIDETITLSDIVFELKKNAYNGNLLQNKVFQKNEIIYGKNINKSQILFLETGVVGKFIRINKRDRVIDFYTNLELLGFNEFLLSHYKQNFYLRAINNVEAISIDGDFLLDYLSIRPCFMEFLVKRLAVKLYVLSQRESVDRKYQRNRVIAGLFEAAQVLGASYELDTYHFPKEINHYLLADYCRVDPTSFSKICKKLMKENLLLLNGRQITLFMKKLSKEIEKYPRTHL